MGIRCNSAPWHHRGMILVSRYLFQISVFEHAELIGTCFGNHSCFTVASQLFYLILKNLKAGIGCNSAPWHHRDMILVSRYNLKLRISSRSEIARNTAVSQLFHLNLKELESGASKCNSAPIEARH